VQVLVYPGAAWSAVLSMLHAELLACLRAVDNQCFVITCSAEQKPNPHTCYSAPLMRCSSHSFLRQLTPAWHVSLFSAALQAPSTP
jgi:predicted amidohydrolase